MFFRKRLKKPDPEAEARLRSEIAAEGGLVLDQYLSGTVRGEGLTLTVNSA